MHVWPLSNGDFCIRFDEHEKHKLSLLEARLGKKTIPIIIEALEAHGKLYNEVLDDLSVMPF